MNRILMKAMAAVAFAIVSGAAMADAIGPTCINPDSGEDDCFGNLYALSGGTQVDAAGGATDVFRFTLDINASGYSGPGTLLSAVGIKVFSNQNDVQGVSLFSAPASGTWAASEAGVNASGCSGAGAGFVCAEETGGGIAVPTATLLTWVFDITVTAGTGFTADPSVKAQFTNDAGQNKGITSEHIMLQESCPDVVCNPQEIPEPNVLALLGLGLMGLGVVSFTRRRNGMNA